MLGSLTLTRKVGEQILIGDDITVEVTRIAGGKVKINIKAPDDVPIRRAELEVEDES